MVDVKISWNSSILPQDCVGFYRDPYLYEHNSTSWPGSRHSLGTRRTVMRIDTVLSVSRPVTTFLVDFRIYEFAGRQVPRPARNPGSG